MFFPRDENDNVYPVIISGRVYLYDGNVIERAHWYEIRERVKQDDGTVKVVVLYNSKDDGVWYLSDRVGIHNDARDKAKELRKKGRK